MNTLNQSQKEAIEYISNPLLIVAGAGTGKTTVITEKIAHLISFGLAKPEEILALTFTDKAANELLERVDARLELGYVDLQVSTFHKFCERLLQEYALDIGLPRQFKLITETDAWLLLRDKIYELGLGYYRPLGNPVKYISDLLRHFSKCKDELITPADYLAHAESVAHETGSETGDEKSRLTELANAYHAYNQLILQASGLDFGDLIFYSVQLLRTRPEILQKVNKQYKYILVDEFQDVNWAQYQLVKELARGGQLTVVGDDDQSIYAFRGASVSNILRFKDDYPTAKSIVLNANYRSRLEILDVAYRLIQNNNPDRLEVKLGLDKKLIASAEFGVLQKNQTVVTYLKAETIDAEVRGVIQEIISLKQNNPDTVWDDFAILARANNHLDPFIRGLEVAGISYEFLSAAGLYRQPIVLDAFSFFKIVHQTQENSALFRLLNLPCLNFDPHDTQKLLAVAKKKSLSYFEALALAPQWGLTSDGIKICAKLHGLLSAAVGKSNTDKPSNLLYSFLEESGYLQFLAHKENEGDRTIIRQIYQLQQFLETVTRFEETVPDPHVAHFVEYLNTILESGDEGGLYQPTDTPDSVNVLSAHGAKGLEFKYVFVVNMVEERFPTRRRGTGLEIPEELIHEHVPEGDYHLEEERRLFYVATTRAKERLYFSSAENYGGVRAKKVSRFLVEAGVVEETPKKEKPVVSLSRSELVELSSQSEPKKSVTDFAPPIMRPAKENPVVYELPKAFSFSQIKSYQTCPYQYKLAHILKLPTKSSFNFSFGQSMHATLQDFYTKVQTMNRAKQESLFSLPLVSAAIMSADSVKVPTLAELYKMYDAHWIPDWYENKKQRAEYYAKGKDILKKFYAAEDGRWTIPVSLEGWFKIKVGNYLVHGRIDRVDQASDGTLHIIDYKTGQAKETLTTEDKEQLLIYQIAAETLPEYRQIGKTGQLTFYYLNDILKTSFLGDPEDLEKIKGKITATIDQIYAGNFTATPSQFICKHCDVRDICEFRVG